MTANQQWLDSLRIVQSLGCVAQPRERVTLEVLGGRSQVDMSHPIVSVPDRVTPGYYKFMLAEALWILSGSQQLKDLLPYAPSFLNYSDGGFVLQGAYGPRVVEQMQYVVECLRDDSVSRQAVIEIWRPMPRQSRDVPCTLSMQFLIRSRLLHCVVSMRSSDLWLGFPFDVFSFTMICCWLLLRLKMVPNIPVESLGSLVINAGSMHIYKRDMPLVNSILGSQNTQEDIRLTLSYLTHPDHLMAYLRDARDGRIDWPKRI